MSHHRAEPCETAGIIHTEIKHPVEGVFDSGAPIDGN